MATDVLPLARHIPIAIPELGIVADWAILDDGSHYLMIHKMCDELGVSYGTQLTRISSDEVMGAPEVLRKLRITTNGGVQQISCLRRAEVSLWLLTINTRKIRPDLRGRMEDVRQRVLMTADKLYFGDRTDALVVRDAPARGGELHVGACPCCHTQLALQVTPGGVHLERAEE